MRHQRDYSWWSVGMLEVNPGSKMAHTSGLTPSTQSSNALGNLIHWFKDNIATLFLQYATITTRKTAT